MTGFGGIYQMIILSALVNGRNKLLNLKMKKILFILFIFSLVGCADVQPHIQPCLEGHVYGFFGGFWHGLIAPFAWIGSLFSDDIAVWAVNNNGGWYTFGFILGIGALAGGTTETTKK